jgi:hypothetical protein
LGNGSSGNAGINGIRWISGKSLHIENCTIFGFNTNGIDIEKSDGGKAFISGSVLANNAVTGLLVKNSVNTVAVAVTNSIFSNNPFGIAAQDFSNVSVFGSEITGSSNTGLQSLPSGGTSTLQVFNSSVTHNTLGLFAGTSGTFWLAGVALFDNSTGIVIAGGTINTAHNNFNNTTGAPNGAASFVQ